MKKYTKLYALPLSIVLIGIASYFIFLYYTHPVVHSQQEVAEIEDKIKNAKQEVAVVDVNVTKKPIQAQKEETPDDIQEIEEVKEVALSQIVEDSITREPVSIKDKKCYEVVVGALNVREAPTTSSDVIEKYYEGDIVCENERAGDWMLADFGWIYAKGFVEPLQESSDFDVVVDEQLALIEDAGEEDGEIAAQSTLTLESKKIDHDAKIQNLTKRYNNSPSYELALDVARLYYSAKNYTEASKWSLIANEHDAKKEDSWVIFANSLNALGKRDEAIKILRAYVESNPDATKAVITLERLER